MDKDAVVKHQQENFGRRQVYRKDGEILMVVEFYDETKIERKMKEINNVSIL